MQPWRQSLREFTRIWGPWPLSFKCSNVHFPQTELIFSTHITLHFFHDISNDSSEPLPGSTYQHAHWMMEMIKFQDSTRQSINMATNLFSTCASDHLSSWNFQQVEPRWSPSRLRSICGAEGWMWWSLIYWHQPALLHLMLIIQCIHHAHYCPGCHSPKIGKVFRFEMLIDMVDIMNFIWHRPRAKGSASSSYHLWCLQMSLPHKSNTCIIYCYCW